MSWIMILFICKQKQANRGDRPMTYEQALNLKIGDWVEDTDGRRWTVEEKRVSGQFNNLSLRIQHNGDGISGYIHEDKLDQIAAITS